MCGSRWGSGGCGPPPPSLQKSIYFNLHRKITENMPFFTQVVYIKSENIGKPYIYFWFTLLCTQQNKVDIGLLCDSFPSLWRGQWWIYQWAGVGQRSVHFPTWYDGGENEMWVKNFSCKNKLYILSNGM